MVMASLEDFDRYAERHGIEPGQNGVAFADWLAQQTGGPIIGAPVGEAPEWPCPTSRA